MKKINRTPMQSHGGKSGKLIYKEKTMYSKEDIERLVADVIKHNEPFLNEYELQFALAMAIREDNMDNDNLKVKIEQNVYSDVEQENCRCDIVVENNNEKVYIELKYVFTMGKQSDKTSESARNSFISDIRRLKHLSDVESYCVFVTNKTAVYDNINDSCYFNTKYGKSTEWKKETFQNPSTLKWNEHGECIDKEPVAHYLVIEPKNEDIDIVCQH